MMPFFIEYNGYNLTNIMVQLITLEQDEFYQFDVLTYK